MKPDLTVLTTFHNEGSVAYTAIRSAVLAARQADRHGICCRIIAVIDCGDEITRQWVYRFEKQLDAIYEVNYADASAARNWGARRINTKYMATLDGDDIFDQDWLWKGVRFLEELGEEKTVAHPQVRLSFGRELLGRLYIPSDSHLFHPLNLIASWHYAHDIILPTRLFKTYPLEQFRHGVGTEDWLWVCESIVEGIRHVVIPETTYFYRRQAEHISLGMLPGMTYAKTRLLDKPFLNSMDANYPSAGIRFADRIPSTTAAIESWLEVPPWLESAVRRACDLDLTVYDLHSKLKTIPIQTPTFFPAVGHLYLLLLAQLLEDRDTVVFFCEHLSPENIVLIDSFLLAHLRHRSDPLTVLLVTMAKDSPQPMQIPDCQACYGPLGPESPFFNLRHVDLGKHSAFNNLWERPQQDVVVRFLMQTVPKLAINFDSTYVDEIFGAFGKAINSGDTRTIRVCRGHDATVEDETLLANWQCLMRAKLNYSIALCETKAIADSLNTCFYSAEMVFSTWGGDEIAVNRRSFGEVLDEQISFPSPEGWNAGSMVIPESRERTRTSEVAGGDDIDVTCLITVQREGNYFHQCLRATVAMCEDAALQGLSTECIIVVAMAGPRTRNFLKAVNGYLLDARITQAATNDVAVARNTGVAMAKGRYVAISSGMDMPSSQWLVHAVDRVEAKGPDSIAHPRALVECTDHPDIYYLPDMDKAEADYDLLAFQNIWPGPILAQRALFQRIPYQTELARSGYGHSDWHWNCETLMADCHHLVIADTAVYRRQPNFDREPEGRLGTRPKTTLPPTRFFSEHTWLAGSQPHKLKISVLGAYTASLLAKFRPRRISFPGLYSVIRLGRTLGPDTYDRISRIGPLREFVNKLKPSDWDEDTYLLANPDVRQAVTDGVYLSGYVHYLRQGRTEGRAYGRAEKNIARSDQADTFPNWLKQDARIFAAFDPGLALAFRGKPAVRTIKPSRFADIYKSCQKVIAETKPTHIIVMAALRPGGSEGSNFHLMQALMDSGQYRVLVITTVSDDTRWRQRLPKGCIGMSFHRMAADLPIEEKVRMLTRLLLNSGAYCLQVSSSSLGWRVLNNHAPAIAASMRIFVSLFALPQPENSPDPGYARFLPSLEPYLSGLFTDNRRAADSFELICGVSRDKITILRHPVVAKHRFTGPSQTNVQVLWAGRFDNEKRPDLLIQIANLLPEITFNVYGDSVTDNDILHTQLDAISNITYHGPFSEFDSIKFGPYGIFLYTSFPDGLPNVLLEAMKSGLLVIAPDVGGLADVVNDDTGVLISNHNDPGLYAAAIQAIYENPAIYRQVAATGSKRVSETFTPVSFIDSLERAKGYLSTKPPLIRRDLCHLPSNAP